MVRPSGMHVVPFNLRGLLEYKQIKMDRTSGVVFDQPSRNGA